MWPDNIVATNSALIWFLLTILPFIFAGRLGTGLAGRFQGNFGRFAWLILPLLALIIRLVPAIILPVGADYDIESYRLTGEALLAGEDVYASADPGRHPYLPSQMYWIWLALWLSRSTGLAFVVLVKMLPIFADAIIVGLIWHIAQRSSWSNNTAWSLALLYALNPISLLVSSYHGQFDSIALLFLLAAWYFWHFGRQLFSSSYTLGLAVLSKTWPLIFLPIILVRLKNLRTMVYYTLVTIATTALYTGLYILVFSTDPEPLLQQALTHTGTTGWWGISGILTVGGFYFDHLANAARNYNDIRLWLITGAGILALLRTRRQPSLEALVTTILAIYVVTPGMSVQWLLWVVPFAIVAKDSKWLRLYSLVGAFFYYIPHLYGLHMASWAQALFADDENAVFLRLIILPVWIVIILWLADRWRKNENRYLQHT